MNRKQLIYTLLSLMMVTTSMSAQVTIGSQLPANKGSILDLKEKSALDGSPNSSRGLGLPRVALEDLTKLSPCVEGSDATNATVKKQHTGLIVYNTKENVTMGADRLCAGIHVWNGAKWEPVAAYPVLPDPAKIDKQSYLPKPTTVTDVRGGQTITYKIGYYAPVKVTVTPTCDPSVDPITVDIKDGLWWMRENAYTIYDKSGNYLSPTEGIRLHPGNNGETHEPIMIKTEADYAGARIKYGESVQNITTTNKETSRDEYAKEFGHFYTFNQAKEACPAGWRLPTDNDIRNFISSLSSNENATETNNDAGVRMRKNEKYYRGNESGDPTLKWGNNLPFKPSGFDAIPSGSILGTPGAGGVVKDAAGRFSYSANWWTSSSGTAIYLFNESNQITIGSNSGKVPYYSVRCVKNL